MDCISLGEREAEVRRLCFGGCALQFRANSKSDLTFLSRTAGHWIKERWLSVALIPLFPGAYMFPGPVADTLLALALPIHNHMGIDVLLTDYVKGVLDPIAKVRPV